MSKLLFAALLFALLPLAAGADGLGQDVKSGATSVGHGFRDGARAVGHGFRDAVKGGGRKHAAKPGAKAKAKSAHQASETK